ncbi:MAG: hypothetical protein H7Y04_13225 [Verrucomicrobia bacterium]|nr:hypothetical protein [Cytophagales bacterium]
MKIKVFLSVLLLLASITIPAETRSKIDSVESWQIYINDELVIQRKSLENNQAITLDYVTKNTVFKIKCNHLGKLPENRFLEITNKHNEIIGTYRYDAKSDCEMRFKATDFFDKLGANEKITIYYSEGNKKSIRNEKVKLVEFVF